MATQGTSSASSNTTEPWSFSTSLVQTLLDESDFIMVELKLVLSTLFILYVGAYAALRRPPSAAPKRRPSNKGQSQARQDDETFGQGLIASDAIVFPLFAGATLIGLYYLIKWLEDPALLNKILKAYMSVVGLASVATLCGDSISLITSIIFPEIWVDREGRLWTADAEESGWRLTEATTKDDERDVAADVRLSNTLLTTPSGKKHARGPLESIAETYWALRRALRQNFTVQLSVVGMGKSSLTVGSSQILGVLLAIVIGVCYHTVPSNHLSNLLGVALCYGAFQLLSCTSFAIGSMLLVALFFYDIVMVFYTPYMVTVATKIDAPIKLVFEHEKRSSILGLGDIVIPGIFICFALRFDLWRYYNSLVKYEPVELRTTTQGGATEKSATISSQTQYRAVKAVFVDPRGRWGDWLWTRWPLAARGIQMPLYMTRSTFPKTYFLATMVGYFIGILVTLTALFVFQHGQPALLYLVPGVVGSAWLTGLIRGELEEMWRYSEDGSLDVEDVIVELDGQGQPVKMEETKKAGSSDEQETVGKDLKRAMEDSIVAHKSIADHEKSTQDDAPARSEERQGDEVADDVIFSLQIVAARQRRAKVE